MRKIIFRSKTIKIHWFFKVIGVLGAIFVFWTIFYYGFPKILPTQRVQSGEIYGLILSDQIWGGDMKIVGDVYSPTNSTVTLLPGTKIKVAISGDKSNMDLLPWHRKSGINTGGPYKGINNGEPFWDEAEKIQVHLNNLVIQGEPSNPVIISSDSINPSPYDFNVFKARSGFITNTIFSNYRRFEVNGNLVVTSSTFKNIGECALCFTKGSPKIENNTFEDSFKESIWIQKASPEITNNLFINLIGEGIKIDSKKIALPKITHNVFEMPQRTAINILNGPQIGEAVIENNIFSGNSLINIACDSKVRIRDNIILGLVRFSGGCSGRYEFGPNFWGTNDPRAIMNEKILDKYDKFEISIPNILLLPPKEAGRK